MDRLSRLIVLALLALCAVTVRAAEPVEWFYTPVLNPEQGMAKRTMEAACQSTAAIYNRNYQGVQRLDAARWYCGMSVSGVDGYVTMRCEDGSTPTPGGGPNGTCAEPPPPPPTCTADSTLGSSGSKWYWKGSGSTTCQGGCLYIADTFAHDKTSGYSVGWGKLNGLGVACTTGNESAGETPPDNKPPNSCEPGKCPGTVNGTTVCVKCGGKTGTVDQKTEENTTDPDAEGEQPAETTTTKTSSRTTCENGQCETETTTTTIGPSGSKSETTRETQSEDAFCQLNPTHKLCTDTESSWGGTCQSGAFSCDGDAVQCAQAQAAWKSYCEAHVDPSSEWVSKGQAAMRGEGESPHGGAQSFSLGAFTSGRVIGPSGGCPSDVTVSLAGTSFTLPFSEYCGVLNAIGLAGNALSMVIAVGIVFGRKGAA